MTYQRIKGKWVGFCDRCNQPFEPAYIEKRIIAKDTKPYTYAGFCNGCKTQGRMLMTFLLAMI